MSEFKKKEKDKGEIEIESCEVNEFGREQIIHNCQFCKKKILTEIEHETTWIGIGFSVILFIIFKLWAVPLIIMLIPLTQQTVHSCPNCLNKVGSRSFYDLFSLSDKLLSFKYGNFALIITKKQILAIFTFLFFCLIFYFFFSNLSVERGNFIEKSWSEFRTECGLNNQPDCYSYKYADVHWKGYVIRIDYNENFFARFRVSVLIKMEKNQDEEPDLFLKFTDYQYENFKSEIFNITRGDYVTYNATILSTGEDNSIPILEVFGFKKLGEHIFIQPHIHHNSRYSVGHPEHIKKDSAIYKELPNLVTNDEMDIDQKETEH